VIVAVLSIYTARHYFFTLNRLLGTHRQPYVDVSVAQWPRLMIFVPAHNEEHVIRESLDALIASDYPAESFVIVPVNDRSTDATRAIVDEYAARHPGHVRPYHRSGGTPGKAAALKDAAAHVAATVTDFDAEVHMVFDADYIPGPRLLRQLAAPFFDPEVGAVMGRVVPINIGRTLITRLLDLERSGGYQVDQQARMNLRLVPQYGGTVGGVRRVALQSVGGWTEDSLAEDTDLTYRLILAGWEVVYQNRSECYEEVPETWPTRIRQIRRWATGHNQALRRYIGPLMRRGRSVGLRRIVDGSLLLGVYVVPLLLLVGWVLALIVFFAGRLPAHGLVAVLAISSFSTVGNFAAFFEVAVAVRLDGSRNRVRLLPFLFFGFLVSAFAVIRASMPRWPNFPGRRRRVVWHKTERHRNTNGLNAAGTYALATITPANGAPQWEYRRPPEE
jgi:cellulose synthase/poly-beta-1,6-N-acetylglucosamine synthase-like glycosyltransferase